jgi:hypothetical protein
MHPERHALRHFGICLLIELLNARKLPIRSRCIPECLVQTA